MPSLNGLKRKNPETGKIETYWRIEWRENGHKRGMALGYIPKKEAETLLAAHIVDQARQPTVIDSKPSLGDWLKNRLLPWLEAQGKAAKTLISARNSLAHLQRLLGERKLDQVGTAEGDTYTATRKKEGARSRTIQIELGFLTQGLRLAADEGVLTKMPKIRKPANTDARPAKFLTEAESARLLEFLPWKREPSTALAIYLALELGLRSGEILSRRWEDIRWGQTSYGALHIGPRQAEDGTLIWQTKTRRARTLPLTAGLASQLRAWWEQCGNPETGWLLRGRVPDRPLTSFKKGLHAACRAAGIAVIHPHALRHSWATRLAIAGVPRATTQTLGGWTSPRVLEAVYQHSTTEMEAEALEIASVPLKQGLAHKEGAQGKSAVRLLRNLAG